MDVTSLCPCAVQSCLWGIVEELCPLYYRLDFKTSQLLIDSMMLYAYETLCSLNNYYSLICFPISAQGNGLALSHPETWLLGLSQCD